MRLLPCEPNRTVNQNQNQNLEPGTGNVEPEPLNLNPEPPWLPIGDLRVLLASTPDVFSRLLTGLSADALHYHDTPGSWSPFQVLCHVVDGEMTDWIPRLDRMLSDQPERPFTPFDREAGFTVYGGWSLRALLGEFARLRTLNLHRLDGVALDDATLARTGIHPEFGPVTLSQLLGCWATHDAAHIAQVSRSLTRYFGEHIGPWRKYFSTLAADDRGRQE